jgi:hypothetical protein
MVCILDTSGIAASLSPSSGENFIRLASQSVLAPAPFTCRGSARVHPLVIAIANLDRF